MKSRIFGSLTGRLLVLSTVVAILGSILIVVTLGASYQRSEQRGFRELLEAHLLAIVAQTQLDDSGQLIGANDAGFPGFTQPASGWYWQVDGPGGQGVFGSSSLAGANLADVTPPADTQFDDDFERFWVGATGPAGQSIGVLETRIFLGDADDTTTFRVSGPTSLPQARVASFTFWLAVSVGTLAALLIFANAIAVRIGLRPLGRISDQIDEIRSGAREKVDERVPTEVFSLVRSLNELIAGNRSVVQRARDQVGNLAHALKTPIAVLQNETRHGDVSQKLVTEQTGAMQASVLGYLDRARIAAGGDGLGRSVDARPVLERLVRVMGKLHPDKTIQPHLKGKARFLGDEQDYEEAVGNLLENAARHAQKQIIVQLVSGVDYLLTNIEDDGAGLSEQQMQEAVKRGRRLDETRPGSGLGLAIVAEIAEAHAGEFVLERSDLGGLKASLRLPLPSKGNGSH